MKTMSLTNLLCAAFVLLVVTAGIFGFGRFSESALLVPAPISNFAADRFTDNGNGTVTDNVTKLIWLKEADCFPARTWEDARKAAGLVNGLPSGSQQCGLADGSKAGDWHLPSKEEWEGFLLPNKSTACSPAVRNKEGSGCCLSSNCAFTGVLTKVTYWSDTETSDLSRVWIAHADNGSVTADPKFTPLKTDARAIWLVRNSAKSSPLSDAEMTAVMNWLVVQVAAIELPVCWRDTYDRGVGEIPGRVADCPSGYTNNGLTCGRSADSISAPSKLADCPAGFKNTGVSCFRGAATADKSGSWCTGSCPSGYTDMGCFCLRPAWTKKLSEATCPSGYSWSKLDGRCHKNCPDGYTNTGETCLKSVDTKGLESMTCKPGERFSTGRCYPVGSNECGTGREEDTGLCYPTCKPGYHGVANLCWQNCPSQQSVECAAGCAIDSKECGLAIKDEVIAPVAMAISLATLGGGTGGKWAAQYPKAYAAAMRLKGAYQTLKPFIKTASATFNAKAHYDFYARQFADDFVALTSFEIALAIDARFGKDGADYIKEQWGYRHLALTMEADGMRNFLNTLNTGSLVDPTGISGVITAYTKPICSSNSVFPAVHRRYTH